MERSLVCVAFLLLLVGSTGSAGAQVIKRVSVSSTGEQGNGESRIGGARAVISADGRYVVFDSEASNLVPDDFNGWTDCFIRDRVMGTTTRVSVREDGSQGNGRNIG